MRLNRYTIGINLSLAVYLCSGCAFFETHRSPKRIEEIRPITPAMKGVSYTIQRKELQRRLTEQADNRIRLVPVYQTVTPTDSYEYRIFDLQPNSAYALLGLQNGDLIVAASGYLIKNPAQFIAYVELLTREDQATIEIKRGGEATLLKYSFVPAV